MELRMQYTKSSDGVRIAYAVTGSGPPLLRVASAPFSHAQLEWQDSSFYHGLADRFTIATFDPRGCGLSDRGIGDLSIEARMRDLDAVVEHVGFERFALNAVGWSGPLAIRYAVEHPDRVTHLILDDSNARTEDFMSLPQIRALDALTGDWDTFLEYLVFTSYGLGRDQAGPKIDFLRACVTPEDAQRMFDELRNDDATDLLALVKVPTLILQHSGLSQKNVESAKDLAASIPGAHMVILDGRAADDMDMILRAMGDLVGAAPDHDHSASGGHTDEQVSSAIEASVRTVLFTDLVGHTEMMSRLGDERGRDVLRDHERITRDVLRANGGAEVKTMGDGFMASFGSVTRSVECAVALQRAMFEHTDAGGEPLLVRVGLNAGEPIEEDGDLFGFTVIMASRIAAKADGGEILCSDVVRGLCSGKGFLFSDRGEFVAKGFEEPVRVYQVSWRPTG